MNAIFQKLNYKGQSAIVVLNSPSGFEPLLAEMEGLTKISKRLGKIKKDCFVISFCTKLVEVESLSDKIEDSLCEDGLFWIAYPKGTSKKYTCDFNRDNGWAAIGKIGFEPVRQVAIDEDWSALRFRKAAFIKSMTRNAALTEEGKKRISKK